ncbi:MAG: hypothetical protein QM501_05015 [Gimesia sp.]
MKIAILTNNANSYPKPMGLGLQRMLAKCDIHSDIFTDGWSRIRRRPEGTITGLRDVITCKPIRVLVNERRKKSFLKKLNKYDIIIVVSHLPTAYMNYFMDDAALRREIGNRPVILYDLVYLPTRGGWADALRNGNSDLGIPEAGHFGIERYDWHLCASVVSETPFPREKQPCSLIGLDIDDKSLYPEQSEFRALLDFEQPGFEAERSVQIEALKQASIPYTELKGRYSIEEIRAVYRKSSLMFLSFRESFGLPICEFQACGGLIATPYSEWAPSHWLKNDLHTPGPGRLGENFLVYDNNVEKITSMLKKAQKEWNPQSVIGAFNRDYPHYFSGNPAALKDGISQALIAAKPGRL